IDEKWKDHLYDLDQLREGIYYRSWGQKDPLVEYKTEAFEMFKGLMSDVENTFAEGWFKDWWRNMPIEISVPGGAPPARPPARTVTGPAGGHPVRRTTPVVATKPAADGLITSAEPAPAAQRAAARGAPEPAFARNPYAGVGRNDPCPCGSGKKFKKCHGAAGRRPGWRRRWSSGGASAPRRNRRWRGSAGPRTCNGSMARGCGISLSRSSTCWRWEARARCSAIC